LREERKRVTQLEKAITRLRRNPSSSATKAPKGGGQWAGKIARLRKTHHLSQKAMALLVGVSLNTVWLWEQGRTSPRAAQASKIQELSGLSAASLKTRLKKVGLQEGRSKPGRKPGKVAKKPTKKPTKKAKAAKKPAKKAKTAKKPTRKAVKKTAKK